MSKKKIEGEQASTAEYSIEDFAEVSGKLFGTDKIIVRAALRTSAKNMFAESEAIKIVNAFRKKEVK